MIVAPREHADLETPYGSMRTYVHRPVEGGRRPGLVLFSEIFQVTAPVERLVAEGDDIDGSNGPDDPVEEFADAWPVERSGIGRVNLGSAVRHEANMHRGSLHRAFA